MPLTTTATATATASTSTSTSYTSTTGQPRLTKKGTGDETLLIKARLLCSQCPALLALPRLLLRLARGLPQELNVPNRLSCEHNTIGMHVLDCGSWPAATTVSPACWVCLKPTVLRFSEFVGSAPYLTTA